MQSISQSIVQSMVQSTVQSPAFTVTPVAVQSHRFSCRAIVGVCGEFLLKGGFHGNLGTSLDPPLWML